MRTRRNGPRRGLTIVESALVLAVFAMLLFGVFEYARFLLVLHTAQNAARDGARYAAVNLNKPTTFDATDYADAGGNTFACVQRYTTARMGGVDKQLAGFQVAVYPADPAGLGQNPPVIRPKSAAPPAYPNPFDPTDPNRVPWNQAAFGERVAVTVRGTYTPITPVLLFLPSSIPITVTALAGSEG